MKKLFNFRLLVLIGVLIMSINTGWGQTFSTAQQPNVQIQSQPIMNGGAYTGTVYEPFSGTTPSQQSYSPAQAPSGPRKEQASGRNPGEVNPEAASNQSPIGEPWVMAIFAAAFAGVIAIRRYKRNLKTTENSIGTTMNNHLSLKSLALIGVLIMSVGQMWAADFTAGKKLYLKDYYNSDLNTTWKASGGAARAFFTSDNNGSKWVQFDLVSGSWDTSGDVYAVTIPAGGPYTRVVITRGSGNIHEDGTDWDHGHWDGSVWNQTVDIQAPSGNNAGKNLISIGSSKDGSGHYNSITWNKYANNAYIEGRFHIQTAIGSGSWTNTFTDDCSCDWNESSTRIPMSWDGTNERFYLHTNATVANLASDISDQGPVFYIKTSLNSNLDHTNGLTGAFQANASTTITSSNGKEGSEITLYTTGSGRANSNLKFSGSESSGGYVVLYFDPEAGKIWYDLEYQVNFGKGTGGNTVSATAGSALSSGNCVMSGTSVTFGHTPLTGYTWAEWNTSSDGSGSQLSTNESYTVTINNSNTTSGAFSAYSKYTENLTSYTAVSCNATMGSVGGTTSGSIGVATSQSVSATPSSGHYFTGWTQSGGEHIALTGHESDNPVTVYGDGTNGGTATTLTANFASRFALVGSEDADGDPHGDANGMPGWKDYTYTLDYVAVSTFSRVVNLKGNTEYKFRIKDIKNGDILGQDDKSISLNSEPEWFNTSAADKDVIFTLDGSDAVTFKITGFGGDHVIAQVLTSDGAITTHSVNFAESTFFVNSTSETGEETGGTVTAKDWKNYALDPGEKAKSGKDVVFTATPKLGYTFAGWYSNEECTSAYVAGSGVVIDNEAKTLTLTIDADKTVYAKFTENRTEVYLAKRGTGDVEVQVSGKWTNMDALTPKRTVYVGVHTTYNIRATAGAGNYFAKWDKVAVTDDFQLGDDTEADYDEDHESGVLKGKGAGLGTQMLYANFYELDKVYFRNWDDDNDRALWENVYVYFNISYSGDCAVSSSDANHKKLMERKGSSDVYWAYIPRDIAKNYSDNNADNDKIAFSNSDFSTSYTFYNGEAADWGHYNSHLDMFVPTHSEVKTSGTGLNGTTYYKGYWKKSYGYVGFLGGYTLNLYESSSYSHAMPNYNFTIVDENTIRTTYYIKNATKTYDFMIESDGEVRYITSPTVGDVGKAVYANDCSAITMTEYNSGYPHFTLHPNKEGLYTFTIDQSGDRMKISIDYPEAVGDYRIKHSYKIRNKADNADSTVYAYSNAVKAAKVAVTDTVSLFLTNTKDPETVLQKCTSINASTKLPVWADQNNTNLSGFNSQEPGVYKAGLTISNDAVSNTPEVVAYTGDYYIHVNAKTKNYLTTDGYPRSGNSVGTKFTKFVKNSAFGDTYDYYWVDWFQKVNDAGDADPVTKAQSVVATIGNDYSNDLAGELGDDDYSVDGKTTTDGANVRYGYDSKSNTFTRAMITGAGSSIKISNSQEAAKVKILTTPPSTYTDCYNSPQSASDADNWMYEYTAQVKPSATASITSSYNDVAMTLANNQKLIEGSGTDAYDLKIIYDFRTNRLITAWIPNPSTSYASEIDLDANMMVVRAADNENDRPTVLNLATGGALNNIKQIYTVMEFTKDYWDDDSWTVTSGEYKDAYFWISLPYDCYISDIFGISDYGSEDGSNWVIQTYRGDLRAEKGWWAETESWWYDMERSDIMKANQGYVIRLTNLDNYGKPFHEDGDISKLQLYFPSANKANLSIGLLGESTTVNYPEIKCTIVRDEENHAGDPNYDRRAIDSNWRIIGSPCFNSAKISTEGWGDTYPTSPDVKGTLQFFYTWSISAGKPVYTIQNASAVSDFEFKATHAYFVQYAGDITWVPYSTTPFVGFKAPERAQEENTDQTLRLVLNKNGEQADVTYIKRMEEGATEGYDLNKDLSKVMNGRMANLYTIAGFYKMAGNCLPETTSIVPVGVRTAVAGDYTFSMPEGTNGTGVILIDNETGVRTNLALSDYNVTLNKGTFDGRFTLELSPIAEVPTGIGETDVDASSVRKVVVDGMLYIVKDGQVYDARGCRLE